MASGVPPRAAEVLSAAGNGLFRTPRARVECTALPAHSLGEIGVPDAIVLKRGPLEPEDFERMKRALDARRAHRGRSPLPPWHRCGHHPLPPRTLGRQR